MTPATIIRRQLDEMATLVMATDGTIYTARPIAVSGTIGEHVRHCLDHIAALVAAGPSQPMSYDSRHRGTAVERDPAEALRQIMRLQSSVDRWGARSMDDPICVASLVAPGESVVGWSTLGRELAFLNCHTIHHQALIAVLLELSDEPVPDRLGLAPSTPRRAV